METGITIKEDGKNTQVYCKEESLEVLMGLSTKYAITSYKSLHSRITTSATSDINSTTKTYKIEISDIINFKEDPQIIAEHSWKDFNQNIHYDNLKTIQQNIMTDFIKNYLLTIILVEDPSNKLAKREQKVINYLESRKKVQEDYREEETEKKIIEIIEYGQATINKEFNISKLEELTKSIIGTIPKAHIKPSYVKK